MNSLNRTRLRQASEVLAQYHGTERHRTDIAERQARQVTFAKMLAEPFSEFTFSQVVRQLWASRIWGNRDYLVAQILRRNGADRLKEELAVLLSDSGSPGTRYERFVSEVLQMGPSMVTEILCYHEPQRAGIWNKVARQALSWLYDGEPLFGKYRLTGAEYDEVCGVLRSLGEQLPSPGSGGETDLLSVDYLLWELRDLTGAEKPSVPTPPNETNAVVRSRHNELRDAVVAIGAGLGFDATAEEEVAPGSKVDAVWRARIANLGSVAYVFEVQDKGSIDSLIVNLQQARATLAAKKLCVVSDREQLDKIRKRVETMPEELRKNLLFWESVEVDAVSENLESVNRVLERVGLLE